jgi:hypothetical protein
VLPRALFADPTAFTRALAAGEGPAQLAALWQQAGDELAPIARVAAAAGAFTATIARRGLYTIAQVIPPPPRETGDACAIVVVGRGDGDSRMSTLGYYVVELVLAAQGGGEPRFVVMSRSDRDERGSSCGPGPLPDEHFIADHVFELYTGHTPPPRAALDVPSLPPWYWWHLLDGHAAVRSFAEARTEDERLAAVRASPVLLLPDVLDVADAFGHSGAERVRELGRDPALADAWLALVQRLANLAIGSPTANTLRTLPLIAQAAQAGILTEVQAYQAEAGVRSRLASLGIQPDENAALAQQLYAAAREAERPSRTARGTMAPPIGEDPTWRYLFLDEGDLPNCTRAGHDESLAARDQAFVAHGGLRAGWVAWTSDESAALARITDARWVLRTATAAAYYLRAVRGSLGDGLPQVAAPQLGDEALAWGGDTPRGRTYTVVVRVGRVIARVSASEGMYAAASRQILHAAMLHPLAAKIAERARQGLGADWLAVAYPTNAVPALMASPGYDAARLLPRYPLLALPDLPAAMTTLGDQYAAVARSLASFQAQVRAHRWSQNRDAMLALVHALLVTDMGDPRVNIAHAHEIVTELRYLDPDPIWQQLDAQCQATGALVTK